MTDEDTERTESPMLSQLIAYYDEYEKELEELHRKAPATAGLLGMAGHPRDDRCNEIFYYNVEKWIKGFLQGNPNQTDVDTVAEWILKLADVHRRDHTYWFCYALQAHAKKLIPLMSREKALELQKWYNEAYPKVDRLPVQVEIYKMLLKHSGNSTQKGFGWFRKR